MNKTAFLVGDEAHYTVTGPPGAPIYWSSSKNGVSTGESYSFYGQYLDAQRHVVGPGRDMACLHGRLVGARTST